MLDSILEFIKKVLYITAEWLLKLVSFLGIAVFGFTAYTVIRYCKKEHPISKKSALFSGASAIAALGAFSYFLKINLKTALLDFPLLTYLPYDKRTDIASHPPWLSSAMLWGFVIFAYILGKWFYKAQEISKTPRGYTIKGKPLYLLLWFATFGVLQIGYLFNIQSIIPYGLPLTIVTTLAVAFMYLRVFRGLKKTKVKENPVKEIITSL